MDGFLANMDQASISLPCLGVPMSPALAAHVHRDVGLRYYVDRDQETAALSFASARILEPDFAFSDELLPADHGIRDVYASRSLVGDAREDVPRPAAGELLLDGVVGAQRPVIVQLVDGTGTPTTTRYLLPGEAMPPYEVALDPGEDLVELPTEPLVRPMHVGLGSAAVGIAAGAVYGVALAQKSQLGSDHPDWTQDDLDGLVTSNHNMVITSGALAGVAVVGGATSLLMWRL
ncbi:MAG: hypothetical protein GY913_14830 [Proteobacteria bacterium]|nr:hypothetical protein [Pseudomonadota bacterium]